MIKEIDIFGVFVPPLLAYVLLTAVLWKVTGYVTDKWAASKMIWHPALFNISIYVLLLAAVVALLK